MVSRSCVWCCVRVLHVFRSTNETTVTFPQKVTTLLFAKVKKKKKLNLTV